MLAGTPYRVVCRLGAGPTGEVFEVEHTELGKHFALKTLLQAGPRFDRVERLRNEFRALARLAHPNIVAVTDAGTTARGIPYFVMPRYRGETLAARLLRGPLRVTEALGIAADIASALDAAHGIGVVHRDVRPDNILLERGGAKLSDFGVAKFLGSSGPTTRHLGLGTPRYMSPEQVSGGPLDARSDLFSLGLVLFELIAGAGPDDDARDDAERLALRVSRPAARLATRVPGLDAEVGAIVAKLLALDPVRRAPSAGTLATQLRRIAARLAGAVGADAPTREVHYDAPTDPGPAPRSRRAVAPACDAAATRPDGIAAGDRSAGDHTVVDLPVKRDEPATRFDLPVPGAARTPLRDEEQTTERIVRAAPAASSMPPVAHAAPVSHKRFLALCGAIGAGLGALAVVALVVVVSLAPEPLSASDAVRVRTSAPAAAPIASPAPGTSAPPRRAHAAHAPPPHAAPTPAPAPRATTRAAARTPPPHAARTPAPAPRTTTRAAARTPGHTRAARAARAPRRIAPVRRYATPVTETTACFRAPRVPSSAAELPASGL